MIQRIFWDSGWRRLRAGWRLLLHLVILLLCLATANLVAIALLSALSNGPLDVDALLSGAPPSPEAPGAALAVPIATLLAFSIGIWLCGRYLDRRRFADFGLCFNRQWWLDFGFGLGLGAGLMALIFVVEWAAGWLTITNTFQTAAGVPFATAILIPLVLFICVGIYEELWSRGYQLKNMAEGFGFLGPRAAIGLATLLSSAIFGVLHGLNPGASPMSTFNIFLAGIFLALGMILTGQLAIPIGLHITWNFFQGNVFGFPVSGLSANRTTVIAIEQGGDPLLTGGTFGPEAGLIGVAAMLLGSVLTVLWVRWQHGTSGLHSTLTTPDLLHEPTPKQPLQNTPAPQITTPDT